MRVAAERLFAKLELDPFVDPTTLKDFLKEFEIAINHLQVDSSNEIWVFPKFAAQFLFPKEESKSKCFKGLASSLLTGSLWHSGKCPVF